MKRLYLKNLSAEYSSHPVLNNISIELLQGQFAVLCGPNGCGKSTLLSVLAGLPGAGLKITGCDIPPSMGELNDENPAAEGEAAFTGKNPADEIKKAAADSSASYSGQNNSIAISKINRKELAKKISYMQQNEVCTWNFTVFDVVLQGRYPYSNYGNYSPEDKKIAEETLEELGLSAFSQRKIHSLSGGEFQKVRIARALCQKPDFMLLDEPGAGLDFVYEPKLLQQLKEIAHKKNIGILISIHDINLAAAFCDAAHLLPPQKSLISGLPEQTITTENLEKTFGVKFECKTKNYFQSSL